MNAAEARKQSIKNQLRRVSKSAMRLKNSHRKWFVTSNVLYPEVAAIITQNGFNVTSIFCTNWIDSFSEISCEDDFEKGIAVQKFLSNPSSKKWTEIPSSDIVLKNSQNFTLARSQYRIVKAKIRKSVLLGESLLHCDQLQYEVLQQLVKEGFNIIVYLNPYLQIYSVDISWYKTVSVGTIKFMS